MVAVAIGTAVVAMGTAGRIMGTAVVAIGTVVVATGAATGAGFFFFMDRNPKAPQQIWRKQQIPRVRRNHAHQGQPPPSVVVLLVAISTLARRRRHAGRGYRGHWE